MLLTDKATARQLINLTDAAGGKLPNVITDTYRKAMQMSEAAASLGVPEAAVAAAVAAALGKGVDPATDKEVQRLLNTNALANRGIFDRVDGIAFATFVDVCRDHADDIIETWRPTFQQATAALTLAHDTLGALSLDDTPGVLARGGDAPDQWAHAQRADQTITTLQAAHHALASITRTMRRERNYNTLTIAAVDYETWTTHQLNQARRTPWQLVQLGIDLSLPTVTEHAERIRTIEKGAADAQARAEAMARAVTTGRRGAEVR